MVGFAVIVGAAIAVGADFLNLWRNLILAFITGFTLTGSAMAVNDYYDREVDAINEPQRPIPSGDVTPVEALLYWLILSTLGLLAAWLTNYKCLAVTVFAWVIILFYSTRGKRTGLFGNLLVSACIALPFIYGGIAVMDSLSASSLLFALMAFLSNTGREVTKGIIDIEGDKANGIRTVAVSRGVRTAAFTAIVLYLSATCISFLPLALGLVSFWYIPFVALTDIGFIHASIMLIINQDRENSRKVKNNILIWMIFGLVGSLTGSFH
jgi:geranylgeranylglycerol-phosphate geranylgeranyltransferase